MIKEKETKQLIYSKILNILDNKIEILKKEIESTKESRNNDTKSSAGDKYETGREMMQIELDKNEAQLNKTVKLKKELTEINIQKKYNKVEFGSLVETNKETYFIAIGIGKIEANKNMYYSISLASPIGKLLLSKKIGAKMKFQEREFTIINIV